jgi:excisionase family DNA binding protein
VDWLSIEGAAERLGVSPQQVRKLVRAGRLAPAQRVGRTWVVAGDAVAGRRREPSGPGRPVSAPVAWLILHQVDGRLVCSAELPDPAAARSSGDRQQRYRARRLLAAAPPVADWDHWLAARAEARPVWAHPGVVDALRRDHRVHPGGITVAAGPLGLGSAVDERPVLYAAAVDLDGIVSDYQLEAASDGQVELRIIPSEVPDALLPAPGAGVPLAVSLGDLVVSSDARFRHLARAALERAVGEPAP